jgi:hypothetical protein
MRRSYFRSFCSPDLANFLATNNNWTAEQKNRILELAKKIAYENGRIKVWIQDFQFALRQLRGKGEKI